MHIRNFKNLPSIQFVVLYTMVISVKQIFCNPALEGFPSLSTRNIPLPLEKVSVPFIKRTESLLKMSFFTVLHHSLTDI